MTTATPPTRMLRSLPAAAHLCALRHVGVPDREIIARARLVGPQQLRRAYRGEPIGWDVERRVLALPIPNEASLYETQSSLGARRRLRALHALGWPTSDLAAALNWPAHKVGNILAERPVFIVDHLAVCALYDQRWTWAPEEHGIPADEAEEARLAAAIGQCASPLAWDDDTIDDPMARARGIGVGRRSRGGREEYGPADPAAAIRALGGDRVALSGRTRTLAITYGARHLGMPWDVIANRLGMEKESVLKSWDRIKKRVREAAEDGERTWVDDPRFVTYNTDTEPPAAAA